MALTQRQLGECASEALGAQQAYDELRAAVLETLRRDITQESKIALLLHFTKELPVLGCPKSEQALAHIRRTSKRNEQRAAKARQVRQQKGERA